MSTSPERLYELLPVIYRQRDEEQGQPLKELLGVIGEQVEVVEEDISQLYENWFIETCQDWLVPYIGDLIGYRPVHEAGEPGDVSTPVGLQRNKILIPRREVANTIRYRRRKGTLALLELLANDVAGWPARAVEFYTLLGFAQAINHLRLERGGTVDLRREDALDRVDGPFDELAHTVDVRRITSHRTHGYHNIPTVGLFVWRLKSYPISQAPAYCREEEGDHCYTFSVLGNDSPLYTRPELEADPTQIAGETNLPTPIRRRAFQAHKADYYGAGKSLGIWVGNSSWRLAPPEEIVPADLSGWHNEPPPGRIAVDPERGRLAFHPDHPPQKGVLVSYHHGFSADLGGGEYDRSLFQPSLLFGEDDFKNLISLARKLGRHSDPTSLYLWDQLSEEAQHLLGSEETQQLLHYYGDPDTLPEELHEVFEEVRGTLIDELNLLLLGESLYVSEEPGRFGELSTNLRSLIEQDPRGWDLIHLNRLLLEHAYPDEIVESVALYRVGRGKEFEGINQALERWRSDEPLHAIIEIADNGVYGEDERIGDISLGEGQTLQLRAENRARPVLRLFNWSTNRPDALRVSGELRSRFTLDGLLIVGQAVQIRGKLASVSICNSTLVPGWLLHHDCEPERPAKPSLQIFNTPHACVNVEHSIIGSIQVNQDEVRADPVRIQISDSVLDATSPERQALGTSERSIAHAQLTVARSTIFGRVSVHAIDLAENSIFNSLITVARRQWGCMRFCYVTPGSRTPRRYNCQLDLVEQALEEKWKTKAMTETEREAALVRERLRVRPQFNSVRYGTPAYCQLAEACAEEIRHGADDESEMGVFHDLFHPQREANLRARLNEYTPAGMNAGIIFAS